jgi:hypothetical protein
MQQEVPRWRDRIRVRSARTILLGRVLHRRYSRAFWAVHSGWALFTGGLVLVLAHNRYGFLPWVVFFLTLTWASTLFFSRFAVKRASPGLRFAQGFVSYLTRVMYQETLFFLLPFYFYSTTFPSWNSGYVFVLAGLAVLSCFDLLFDRLLRTRRPFAVGFFAVVTYSALQFFLPLFLHVQIHNGAYLAAGLAFFASLPVAYTWRELRQGRRLALIGVALLAIVGMLKVGRAVLPPVPLRLSAMSFAADIDPQTLQLQHEVTKVASASELASGRLCVRATIFSPGRLPVRLRFRFYRNGTLVKSSRSLDLVAHPRGFRVWDALRAGAQGMRPGIYRVEVVTDEGQLVGRGDITITGDVVKEAFVSPSWPRRIRAPDPPRGPAADSAGPRRGR